MRTAERRLIPLVLGLFLAGLALGGCTDAPPEREPAPGPTEAQGVGLPGPDPVPTPSRTPAEAFVQRATEVLDASTLPAGFFYDSAMERDVPGSTSTLYVNGEPQEQGPALRVLSGRNGPTALTEGWREVPELSGTFPVSVGPTTWAPTGTTVTIDATPAGVVQLVGDGIPEQDLLDLAARLLTEP
ncbi:hypothetical protein ACFVQ3_08450 [Oerskovia sp. NPDC057915]|uniref:hypothetical protein n=1 Tax=Oerskovia sp. NPDC057915 TaxID=3346280 RepID=UPI0036D93806